MNEQERAQAVARCLLDIKAVYLRPDQPFTWASGILSPIYCDNRVILAYPEARETVESGLAALVRQYHPDAEVLMGTATAGIAHAAIAAHKLGLPMGYVRSAAKSHGCNNKIEGKLDPGQRAVVIEDLISTGGSCLEAVSALREAGAEVAGVACIFTYNIARGRDNFRAAGTDYHALCTLETLLEVATATGYVTPRQAEEVLAFRNGL